MFSSVTLLPYIILQAKVSSLATAIQSKISDLPWWRGHLPWWPGHLPWWWRHYLSSKVVFSWHYFSFKGPNFPALPITYRFLGTPDSYNSWIPLISIVSWLPPIPTFSWLPPIYTLFWVIPIPSVSWGYLSTTRSVSRMSVPAKISTLAIAPPALLLSVF